MKPLFADEFHLMEVTDVKRMASSSSSNDKFCSLDMLAEVASATLQNDPSLTTDFSFSRAKNRVGNASPRKSVNSCEKLSLDQIKSLSEKNLIEMFSELICDEMKRNYSFQCFLIPDKCSQVFKSFGNETRARCNMKNHLQSHISDLVAAANVTSDHEVFMAEPLHVRRKRLREMNQKNTRKKKRIKQPPVKLKKDTNSGLFHKDVEDFNLLKSGDHQRSTVISNSPNTLPGVNYSFNSAMNLSVNDDMSDNFVNHVSKKCKGLSYFSSNYAVCDPSDEQVILGGQSDNNDFAISLKNSVKMKHRSRHPSDAKKRTSSSCEFDVSPNSSTDHDGDNSNLNCVVSPVSELSLPILHDHTYTSISGNTFNCDRSSASESNRSANKVFREPFNLKKTAHRCSLKESPLIIPTPPFPYVYIPLLPHIALIQEVGRKFKTSNSKCICDEVTESLHESYSNHVPLFFQRENKWPNVVNQSASNSNMVDRKDNENLPAVTYSEVIFEDRTNSETSDLKLSDSPFYVDDLMRNENPETVRAREKE